ARTDSINATFGIALNDADARVQAAGATALGYRPRIARHYLGRLAELLEDHSPEVRKQAAFAIGQTGQAALEQVNQLKRLAQSETNLQVRATAERSIGIITRSAELTETPPKKADSTF